MDSSTQKLLEFINEDLYPYPEIDLEKQVDFGGDIGTIGFKGYDDTLEMRVPLDGEEAFRKALHIHSDQLDERDATRGLNFQFEGQTDTHVRLKTRLPLLRQITDEVESIHGADKQPWEV